MSWHIVVKFLDADDNVLATRDTVDPRNMSWKIPVKTELTRAENDHITVEWKKVSILVERG